MENYLINAVNTYRVPTVDDALALRESLENTPYGELTSFQYKTKQIKLKGEVIEEYQLVRAQINFTSEKEPEDQVTAKYEVSF